MDFGRMGFGRGDLVDLIGIEPMTSSMPWKRAPNCATGPRELSLFSWSSGDSSMWPAGARGRANLGAEMGARCFHGGMGKREEQIIPERSGR